MEQNRFSFMGVLLSAKTRQPSKKRKPRAAINLTIEAIAKLIDPGAWEAEPSPSRERLEIELAQAKEEIKGLREELEWLQAAKGETATFSDPVLIHKTSKDISFLKSDALARQEEAAETATKILALCKRAIQKESRRMYVIGRRSK